MTQKAENMRVYTTYFANIRNLPDNVVPISITLKSPPSWAGAEFKKLAPPYQLLKTYKQSITSTNIDKNNVYVYYIKRYFESVLHSLEPESVLSELELLAAERYYSPDNDYDVALVCYEPPTDFCHRHIVSEWFRLNGIECKEYNRDTEYIRDYNKLDCLKELMSRNK